MLWVPLLKQFWDLPIGSFISDRLYQRVDALLKEHIL